MNEYEKDLKIDYKKINKELIEQPEKYAKYSLYLANAGNLVQQAKKELEVIRAKLSLEIREINMPDSEISNNLVIKEEFQNALDEHNKAVHNFNIMQGIVKSFEQRQTSLTDIVNIIINGYDKEITIKDNILNNINRKN